MTRLDANWILAAEQVREDYEEIKKIRNPFLLRCGQVTRQFNGDIALALPELDKMEKPAVANLIAQGIEQTSMSIASVRPRASFSVLGNTDIAQQRSDDSRRALYGWWDMNDWDLMTPRRARHLVAYGETVVSLSPVGENKRDKRKIPHWKVRNPLNTFAAPCTNPDDMQRDWVIFVSEKTVDWFQKNYPQKMGQLFPTAPTAGEVLEVLEYIDEYETVLVGLGSKKMDQDRFGKNVISGVSSAAMLERVPHNWGFVPVVVAGKMTLDQVQGQYYQALGTEQRRAMLDALNTIAIFRNIFADEWAVSSSNSSSSARIIKRADGKRREIGIIDKGQLQVVRPPLNQEIGLALDRYEGVTRQYGVPAQMSGLSPSNVRSARQSNDIISNMLDMNLMMSQTLLAKSSEIEAYFAINLMKSEYGAKPSSFFFGFDGKIPHEDYTPNDTFVTDVCKIRYPMPGRDAQGMAVEFGQKHGIGEMSLQTMRELDQDIADADIEAERVEIENVERAFSTGLEQKAAQGDADPVSLARIIQLIRTGKYDLVEATIEVNKQMQAEQAAVAAKQQQDAQAQQQQAPDQNAQPGMGATPENPNTPAPAPGGATSQPSLQDLLSGLGNPTPEEVQPNAVAQAPAPAPAGV